MSADYPPEPAPPTRPDQPAGPDQQAAADWPTEAGQQAAADWPAAPGPLPAAGWPGAPDQPVTPDPRATTDWATTAGLTTGPDPHTTASPTTGPDPQATDGRPGAGQQAAADPAAADPAAGRSPRAALGAVRAEVAKAVVGQDPVLTGLLIALICQGHVLLEGVPGVAKTLLVRSLAQALSLQSKRIQFTPDLMPGDVTGSLIYDARTTEFEFREGPVFTNLLLADEINRTPPKTQAALLEAMEERQVSVDGMPRRLPEPFCVAATQNPIEYEGTYPLPEAQLDRFLLKLTVTVPERADEIAILARHAAGFDPRDLAAAGIARVAGASELAAARAAAASVRVQPEVAGYIVDLCRATRQSAAVLLGVSPRGATALLVTSRAWAWLSGRDYVTPDDVKTLARPALRHRIMLRPESELDGATADGVIGAVLATVPVPR